MLGAQLPEVRRREILNYKCGGASIRKEAWAAKWNWLFSMHCNLLSILGNLIYQSHLRAGIALNSEDAWRSYYNKKKSSAFVSLTAKVTQNEKKLMKNPRGNLFCHRFLCANSSSSSEACIECSRLVCHGGGREKGRYYLPILTGDPRKSGR